jgi:predicted DNA-binding transcriptional regulator AlpA
MQQHNMTVAESAPTSQHSAGATRPYRIRAKQAAAHLSIATSHFYALVADGHLPKPQKIGRMSFWRPGDIEAAFDKYMASRQCAA